MKETGGKTDSNHGIGEGDGNGWMNGWIGFGLKS